MKEYQITLDLIQSTDNEAIYVKIDDLDSVKFAFEILNNGETHDLTGYTSVRLAVQRPSGYTFYQECTVTDEEKGLCEVVLTNEGYSESGLNLGEVYITQNGIVQVTQRFEYNSLNSLLTETQASEVVYWVDILEKPTEFPPEAHTHLWADLTDKPTEFTPEIHTHDWGEIQNTPTTLGGYGITDAPTKPLIGSGAPTVTPEFIGQIFIDDTNNIIYVADGLTVDEWQSVSAESVEWTDILNKPIEFPPEAHTHAIADVTNLQTELDSKLETIPDEYLTQTEGDNRYELQGEGATPPLTGITDPHDITPEYVGQLYINTDTDVAWIANSSIGDWYTISKDDLPDTYDWTEITNKPTTFPPDAHTHAWADVTNTPTTIDGYGITDATPKPVIGSGAPTITPEFNGQIFIDDTNNIVYVAEGETSTDWQQVSNEDVNWADILDKPTEFYPTEMSGTTRGGAIVGSGLRMASGYLTLRTGVAIFIDESDYSVAVDKTVTDGWYAKNDQGVTIWKGTQAEYDALGTYDDNTLYFID